MEQLDLFAAADWRSPLTVADIDEWAAVAAGALNPHAASHWPAEWARVALSAALGEEIPDRRWSTRELLALLDRARTALTVMAVLTPDDPALPADPGGE